MSGDPLGEFGRDLERVAADLDDPAPSGELAQQIADATYAEAPRATGYLASTVTTYAGEVVVGAPYAAVVAAIDGYVDRALAQVEPADPFLDHLDDVLDHHLSHTYT